VADVVTLDQLRTFLVSHFEVRPDQVVPSARLMEDLELDSLDAVDLVVRLEQETGVEIAEEELRTLATVQDVLDLLGRKLATERNGGG
jgi:acyl carrier protein